MQPIKTRQIYPLLDLTGENPSFSGFAVVGKPLFLCLMKPSPIKRPMDEKLCIIRESYLNICEGDACAAAILNFFEGWVIHKGNELQWHTAVQISENLLGLYGESSVRYAIQHLVKLKFITISKNPNPKFGFDKTNYYWLNINEINEAIALTLKTTMEPLKTTMDVVELPVDALKTTLRDGEITASIPQNYGMEAVNLTDGSGKITGAITEITYRDNNRDNIQTKSDQISFTSVKDISEKDEILDSTEIPTVSKVETVQKTTVAKNATVQNEIPTCGFSPLVENANSTDAPKDKKNSKKNSAPAARKPEVVKETNPHHHAIIDAYHDWYNEKFAPAQAHICGRSVKCVAELTKRLRKSVVSYLSQSKMDADPETLIVKHWVKLLENYDSWDKFYPTFKKNEQPIQETKYRNSTRLYEIERDFDKIILNWLTKSKIIQITEIDTRSDVEKRYDAVMKREEDAKKRVAERNKMMQR